MNTKLTKPAAIGLLLALHGGWAGAMDVAEAYRQSLNYDPTSLAADQALSAGREKTLQGDALLRPQVSLQAGMNRIHDHENGELPAPVSELLSANSTGTARQATLQLVQPLYDRAAQANRLQLHEQTAMAQTRFAASRQDQALRVAETYFGVLLAEETLRVVRSELAAVRQQRDRAQARSTSARTTSPTCAKPRRAWTRWLPGKWPRNPCWSCARRSFAKRRVWHRTDWPRWPRSSCRACGSRRLWLPGRA